MNQSKSNSIQGLRFWAIGLIVASHCGFLSQGGLGNCIFFAMSGFFACQPFADEDYEYGYFSPANFIKYYIKRILRIMPVAWLVMAFAAWGLRYLDFRDFTTENSLLLNMLFLNSKGHLWFLQQEVFFYILAPFMILIIGLVKKILSVAIKKGALNLVIFILLTVCVFLSYKYVPMTGILLKGNGAATVPMLWLFLIGMSFAYLYKVLRSDIRASKRIASLFSVVGSMFVVTCLILTIITSEEILSGIDAKYTGFYVGWEHQIVCAYLAATVMVTLALLPKSSLVNRLLGNSVFTALGNASFSLYLIHFFLIGYFAELSVYSRLLVVGVLSIAMALMLYNYVEKPIMAASKKWFRK